MVRWGGGWPDQLIGAAKGQRLPRREFCPALPVKIRDTREETAMLKFLGSTIGIIFLIGLLVVIGLLMLIF